jgi:RNA polymerase sigma factor (sigma-70 family)
MALQERDSLAELLELVSPQDQLILRYRYVDGLNGHELATALGIRENAARVRLNRALQRLTAAYFEAEQAGKGGRE